jgi:PAS domain S-box-containing protein
MRKIQRRLELILNAVGEGIFGLDNHGSVTFVNNAAASMLGWRPDEIVGKAHHELVHHHRADGSPYPEESCPITSAFRDGLVHKGRDEVFWKRDNTAIPVEYLSTPIVENSKLVGAVVVFRDISGMIKAQARRKQLQRQMALILNSAGEGIFGLDNQGRVIFVNQAALLMLGWQKEDLTGKSHHELIHHHRADGSLFPEDECPIYMAYRDGKVHFSSDDIFWCKDGTSFHVEYVSTPIKEEGRLIGAVVVFRDKSLAPYYQTDGEGKNG